jgi:hypothetical protein
LTDVTRIADRYARVAKRLGVTPGVRRRLQLHYNVAIKFADVDHFEATRNRHTTKEAQTEHERTTGVARKRAQAKIRAKRLEADQVFKSNETAPSAEELGVEVE